MISTGWLYFPCRRCGVVMDTVAAHQAHERACAHRVELRTPRIRKRQFKYAEAQARNKFLIECGQAMAGRPFFLEAQDGGPRSRRVKSIEEARQTLKPSYAYDLLEAKQQLQGKMQLLQETAAEAIEAAAAHRKDASNVRQSTEALITVGEVREADNLALVRETSDLKQELRKARHVAHELEIAVRCAICCSKRADTVLMPCKHVCCCQTCWARVSEENNMLAPCPICRVPVQGWIQMRV
ncbi:unnamed protein product [Effrenium voratum]|nr:unnamed protein product [Effrenium voratum]